MPVGIAIAVSQALQYYLNEDVVPVQDNLLLEDGFAYLLEDGGAILLE